MSAPDERSVGGCNRMIYSVGHTHNYGWVHRIGQPGNILGFGYEVNSTELHIDPDKRHII